MAVPPIPPLVSGYRIPDVMLCPLPLPSGKVVTSVPWVIVKRIGVRHVALLDPEQLIETEFTSLDRPSGSIPFDTPALFQQLVQERTERASSG